MLLIHTFLYYVRIYEWDFFPKDVPLFVIVGILSVIAIIITMMTNKEAARFRKTDWMMLYLLLCIGMSHLSYGYVGGAISSMTLFMQSLVFYFLVTRSISSLSLASSFSTFLILITSFLALESVVQNVTGVSHGGMEVMLEKSFGDDGDITYLPRSRWFGPFSDPNDLGLALVIPIPFLINRFFSPGSKLITLLLPLVLYGIYLTNSRGTQLSLIVSISSYFVVRSRNIKSICICLLVAVLIIVFGPSRVGTVTDASSQGRLEAWIEGLKMFANNPLFGVGCRSFTEFNDLTAHNSFFLVLAELGFLGFVGFFSLFYYPLGWAKNNILRKTSSPEEETKRSFLVAVFSSFIGMLTSMLFLSRAYFPVVYMMLAFLFATIDLTYRPLHLSSFNDRSDGFGVKRMLVSSFVAVFFLYIVVKVLAVLFY